MEQENYLINQRVTFNTVIQSTLLASYTFSTDSQRVGIDPALKDVILKYVPWLGFWLICYAFLGVLAALIAHDALGEKAGMVIERWKTTEDAREIPDLLPSNSVGGGNIFIHYLGLFCGPWAFLAFGFFWVVIIVSSSF